MINVDLLKVALRISQAHTADDVYLAELEAAAVVHVEDGTVRYLGPVDTGYTSYSEGQGDESMWLPYAPASPSNLVIEERGSPGAASFVELVEDVDYQVRGEESMELVRLNGLWADGYDYKLVFDRGYASDKEPAWARNAVIQIVAHWYENRTPVVVGTIAAAVPEHVQKTIIKKRRWNV